MSDEELDNLFRKSVESFDPPYDPEAWQAMEQKLEKTGGGTPGFWRALPLVLLLLLMSTSTLLDLRKDQEQPQQAESLAPAPPATPGEQLPLPDAKTGAVTGEAKLPGGHSSNRSSTTPVAQAALPVASEQSSMDRRQSAAGRIADKNRPTIAVSPKTTIAASQPASLPPRHGADKVKPGNGELPASPLQPDTTGAAKLAGKDMLPIPAAPDSVAVLNQPDSAKEGMAEVVPPAESQKKSYFLKQVQVMLAVAPDLTMVKFKDPRQISPNAGLLVGVPLSRRLSLVSGVLWADKRYGALPGDYAPSSGYWDGKHLPDYINATCKVLDIPLNLRWLVLERGRNQLTVQAGLSSYIMLNEQYEYNYESNVSYPYTKTYAVDNQNRHWLAVQNFSVGYSRKLSPAFTVGAEPFVKIPLSAIGAGNVKLTSAGLLLMAGYTFDLKK